MNTTDTQPSPAPDSMPRDNLPWRVDVVVCGHPSGSYYFRSKSAATRDANNRRRKFGVLGCSYRVRPNQLIADKLPIMEPSVGFEPTT